MRLALAKQFYMIRMQLELALSYQIAAPGADFVFNVHAAQTPRQRIVAERFEVSQSAQPEVFDEAATGIVMPGCEPRRGR